MGNSRRSPPETAIDLPLQFLAALARAPISGKTLLLAYSGGMDSTALLHMMRAVADRFNFRLSAVHVNHGLQPEADDWVKHCQAVAQAWQIPLEVMRVRISSRRGQGLEAAARQSRHTALSQCARRVGASAVLLAHHQDDQAETLLHQILRGTGLAGASAMREDRCSSELRLLRPLLAVSRAWIKGYAQRHHLSWIEDPSNQSTAITRNFIRHVILPEIQTRFPRASKNLAGAASRFSESLDLINTLAEIDLGGRAAQFPLPVDMLKMLSEARARNVLRWVCVRTQIPIPSQERLDELLRQMCTAAMDRHPEQTWGEWHFYRYRSQLCVEHRVQPTDLCASY
jgi:tRNA(Ile)-lysidine synthase